jgi:thermitase
MRARVRGTVVGLMVGGLVLTAGPAPAGAAEQTGPVSLVVGLRTGSDVVATLERHTGVDVVGSAPMAGAVTVDVPAEQAGEAADALRADPAVSYVEPDYLAHMATVTPNDPSYAGQWGIAKTRVNTAWGSTAGSSTVTVAVLDTGVAALPDLAGRLLPGKDFVNNDNAADDDNGHGTMTAGVIAAGGDNGVGIAGICWACRILPVKVLNSAGSGTYSNIAAGIRYAADSGADIINMSLGGSADGQVLRDAVAYAVGKGALVISTTAARPRTTRRRSRPCSRSAARPPATAGTRGPTGARAGSTSRLPAATRRRGSAAWSGSSAARRPRRRSPPGWPRCSPRPARGRPRPPSGSH